MKLKYYMRGLGIGIFLTTLILLIANPKDKLSDEEIKERATKMGMVMAEEEKDNLDKVLGSIELTKVPSLSPDVTPSNEPTLTPTKQPDPSPTISPTSEPEPTSAVKPIEDEHTQGNATDVTFVIKSGMSSGQVASLLEEKGLIKDSEDFNQYIVKKGKASTIHVGTYTIKENATYDEIIKLITS